MKARLRHARGAAWACLAAGWLPLACLPVHAVTFDLVDLGSLGGLGSSAYALNNRGQVVGASLVGEREHAFSWTAAGGMVDLDFTPGGGLFDSSAAAVNDAGLVLLNAGGRSATWSAAAGRVLLPVRLAGDRIEASGINQAGRVVGTLFNAAGSRAFSAVAGGLPVPLSSLVSSANAINEAGMVAGNLGAEAVLWSVGGLQHLGSLGTFSTSAALNGRGQIVGVSGLSGESGGGARAFLWQGDAGMISLGTLGGSSSAKGINDAGQVVGWSDNGLASGHNSAFLWSASTGMVDLNTLLSAGSGVRVADATAINQLGQIVGQSDGGRAVLLTPMGSLAWLGRDGGSFNDGRQWELGFAPNRFLDAQLLAPGAQTVLMGRDAVVNSLGLGAASGGRVTLRLQEGALLEAAHGVTVRATGVLAGDGRVAGGVVNLGTVQAGDLRIDGVLVNQGLVVAGGRLFTDLENGAGGQLRVARGELLVLGGGAHRNAGVLEVRGGELEIGGALANQRGGRVQLADGATLRLNDGMSNDGQLTVGFGGATVFGRTVHGSGGRVVLSGNSNTTFEGDMTVEDGAELRVSAGSAALFFGLVQQRSGALFTGTGTKFYEGGLSVGDSPGLGVDEGSIALGQAGTYLVELGGLTPGSGHDKLVVQGALRFGGTLKLVAWNSFAAQAGQRFDLFDWGSASGQFDRIDASGWLGPGLALDTSRLYLDGSIGVTAVPEPGTWMLLAMGLAGFGLARRRGVGGTG